MRFKIVKYLLLVIIAILLIFSVLLTLPRLWSALNKEKPPVGYHFITPVYIAAWIGLEKTVNLEPVIPQGIKEIKDIEYKNVNGKSLRLDMYIPDTLTRPAPLLVFIHGGGWKGGKRSDYLVYLVDFASKGYVTATVSYRLLADSLYPACAQDITDAVKWFSEHGEDYGYDAGRIALIGGSAGGHLALLAAYGWNSGALSGGNDSINQGVKRVKAVVDIYGPYDLTTEYARNHSLVKDFIGHSFEESPELYLEASPKHYLDAGDPPTLILHGTSDELVPVSQSDSLACKLEELGIQYRYCRLPLWPHVMDVVKRVNDYAQQNMEAFFDQYLK